MPDIEGAQDTTPVQTNSGLPDAAGDMSDTELDNYIAQTLEGNSRSLEPVEDQEDSTAAEDKTVATDDKKEEPAGELHENNREAASGDDQVGAESQEKQRSDTEDTGEKTTSGEEITGDQPSGIDTADLFIEITDANGKEHKLTLDGGIPEDLQFANDKQLFETLQAFQEMRDLKASRESELTEKAQKAAANQAYQERLKGWDNEVNSLVEAGLIQKPAKPPANGKQYTAEEVAADENLQKIDAIFGYMNDKKIASFGTAYSLYTNEQRVKAEEEAQKKDNDLAKSRASLIGGATNTASDGDKPFVYVPGKYRSIHEVPVE